ncbi:hypothetical protein MKW94_018051, partial [Papaver nudicaule]|nr:hypothetical protein [Papaver nudicaule]
IEVTHSFLLLQISKQCLKLRFSVPINSTMREAYHCQTRSTLLILIQNKGIHG